jgi:hypothetical protein
MPATKSLAVDIWLIVVLISESCDEKEVLLPRYKDAMFCWVI